MLLHSFRISTALVRVLALFSRAAITWKRHIAGNMLISLCSVAFLMLLLSDVVAAEFCHWADGSDATNTMQCGTESWCCYGSDTCMQNGLYRDVNNNPNGTITEPGLYQVESCNTSNYTGCLTYCLERMFEEFVEKTMKHTDL